MTRTFNEKIRCPTCGTVHTAETDFERWVRNNERMDSVRAGICRFDIDMLLHRYKVVVDGKGDRSIQCMMFVEVKTRMAEPTNAQSDTLGILNQVLRNRRPNIHSTPRGQIERQVTKAYSKILRRDVQLMLYGGHLLQLSGTRPDNSCVMRWDRKSITESDLIDVLTFERNPDNPELKLDHRRRNRAWSGAPRLFDLTDENT